MISVLKKIGWAIGIVLFLIVYTVWGGFEILQTPSGKQQLVQWIEKGSQSADQKLQIGSLDGQFPSSLTLTDILISDAEGLWLKIDRLETRWNPWDLLDGRVKIKEVSFQTVELLRKPMSTESPKEAPAPEKSGGFPLLPVTVEVDYLGAQKIRLHEDILGEKVELTIESRMAYLGLSDGLSMILNAQRIDQTPGSLKLDASFLPQSKNLTLNLNAEEPPGGVLVRVLKITDLPAMSATIKGDGSLENWESRFNFHAGKSVNMDGTAHIKTIATEEYSLEFLMDGNISPLVDPAYREILKDPVHLKTNLTFNSSKNVKIKTFDINNSAFQINVNGNVQIQNEKLDLKYSLIPTSDQPYQSLAPGLRWKALKVSGGISGLMSKPDIGLTLDANSLAQDEFFVPLAYAKFQISPDRPLDKNGVILNLNSSGLVSKPKGPNPAIEQLIPDKLSWKLISGIHLDQQQINIKQFETSIEGLTLALKGDIKQWGERAKINLDILSPDISKFSEIANTKIAGNLNVGLEIEAQEFGQIVKAKISTVVQNLATEFPEVQAIVGDQIFLTGGVVREQSGLIRAQDFKFSGAEVSGVINAVLTENQKLDSDWYIHFPRLAQLSDITKKNLSGQLDIWGKANGALDSPTVATKIESKNLVVDGLPIEEARLDLTAWNLSKNPSGTLATKVKFNEIDASTSTEFTMQSDDRLALKKIYIQGVGSEITGDMQVNLKPVSLTGVLNGQIKDYSSINDLLAHQLSGKTRFGAVFSNEGGQTVKFSTNVNDFVLAGESPLSVETLQLAGLVTNALKKPQIKSQLKISGATHHEATLENLVMTTQGSLEETEFSINAQAIPLDGPTVKLNTAGKLNMDEDLKQLTMNSLSGSVGDIPFKLTEPALVTISGSDVELKKLALNIKDGLVTSGFKKSPDGMFVDVSVDRFPLDLVNQVQPGLGMGGILKGKAVLSANRDDPKGNLNFSVNDLTFAEVSKKGLSPASANLGGTWEGGLAKINFLLTQPSVGDFKINGELPLVMDQESTGIKVPAKAPLKATADGKVDLDILNNMLMASGNQVQGKMELHVTVGGELEQPQLAGTLNLQEGKFENLNFGTTLDAIELKSTFDQNQLQLVKLMAITPKDGSLSASGTVTKTSDNNIAADLKLSTKSAQLVATDVVTAQITSDLQFIGPINSALLKGVIGIDKADIYVPNTLPPSVVVLDVEEADETQAEGDIKIEPVKKEEAFDLGLDLKINAPNEIFVRGRGLDAELEGNLLVTGTTNSPSVDGAFKMRRGTLEILSRKVKFKQGVVGFDGVPDREPDLDFKAEIPTKNITILVDVLGAVSNPKIKLSSNPEMPQDEILSNLLFDKSAGAMTPLEAVQLANSAAQLAGLGGEGPGFMDKVRGSLGLDTLKLSGEGSGPGVEAGSYVADGVYIGVKQDLLNNSSSAVIEYEVTPNVTVESDIGAESQSRVGVKMEWDY